MSIWRTAPRRRFAITALSALAVVLVIAGRYVLNRSSQVSLNVDSASDHVLVKRFPVPMTQNMTNEVTGHGRSLAAISPDGRSFVYTASDRLYLRWMDQIEALPIPGTEESPLNPFFSPDGQSVAYFTGGALAAARG
jgi:hypothetical protein